MKLLLQWCKSFWGHYGTQSALRTLYYLLVLLGLLWIYGLNSNPPPSHFIYTDF
jgi:hypothetical protein